MLGAVAGAVVLGASDTQAETVTLLSNQTTSWLKLCTDVATGEYRAGYTSVFRLQLLKM